jgi:hypothetical protein
MEKRIAMENNSGCMTIEINEKGKLKFKIVSPSLNEVLFFIDDPKDMVFIIKTISIALEKSLEEDE